MYNSLRLAYTLTQVLSIFALCTCEYHSPSKYEPMLLVISSIVHIALLRNVITEWKIRMYFVLYSEACVWSHLTCIHAQIVLKTLDKFSSL